MPSPVRSSEAPTGEPKVSERLVNRVIWILGIALAAVVALIAFTPHRPPPPPSPAQPDQAVIDRVGLVSPAYVRSTAGALLNEPLAQILVYIDKRPPGGSLEDFTINAASAWRIGTERGDTGLVLFVFPDTRKARVEVGYGLEGTLPDARVRQLLEATLVPRFGRGEYEGGLDAFLAAVRQAMRDDSTLQASSVDGHARASFTLTVFKRFPSLLRLTWFRFVDEGIEGRIVMTVFVVFLAGVLAIGVTCVVNTLWRVATLRRNWANSPPRRKHGTAASRAAGIIRLLDDLKLYEIVAGIAVAVFCAVVWMLVLSLVESYVTRKGHYSGAGAAITWSAPQR